MTCLSWQRLLGRSSAVPAHGDNTGEPTGGGMSLAIITRSRSTTAGTTCTTTSSGLVVGEQSFDFSPFIILQPTVVEEIAEEERAKMLEHIRALVVRFPSDDDSAPGRWLSELEATWVLYLNHGSEESGRSRSFISGQVLYLARSWIQALFEITKPISVYFGAGWCSIRDKEEDKPPAAAASEFIRLVEATFSRMLPFVDAIVAAGTRQEPVDEKLQALFLLHDALSTVSEQILSSFSSSPLAIGNETQGLLSAELPMAKLDQATWNTIEEAKAGVMSSLLGTPRSSDIHPITRSFVRYIKVLWANHGSVNRILHNAFLRGEFVPANEYATHLTNLTTEMLHSLQEKFTTSTFLSRVYVPIEYRLTIEMLLHYLEERSPESILDESRIFLLVINNLHYLLQQLSPFGFPMPELPGKIEDGINIYIRLSWAPMLRCLHNPTTRCFTRRSPLQKFESKFHKTYTAQKLWKVPDPEMRKRMREAIVEQVIPGFTEFFKDNTISNPTITPQVMKNMLQELFEG